MSKLNPKPLNPNAKAFDYYQHLKKDSCHVRSYHAPLSLQPSVLPHQMQPTLFPGYDYSLPCQHTPFSGTPLLWNSIPAIQPFVASVPPHSFEGSYYNYTTSATSRVCAGTADARTGNEEVQRKNRDLGKSELSMEAGEVERGFSLKMGKWVTKRYKGLKDKVFLSGTLGWRPKVKSNSLEKDVDDFAKNLGTRTSLMIRNVPNKFRDMLIKLLDDHCKEENQKAQSRSEELEHSEPTLSKYDFVYLPIDFRTGCNKGYAFVNFTSSVAALRLYESLHGYKWDVFDTKKVCEITIARIQGKNGLVGHFRLSRFPCETDEFLPVVLSPPRNGATSCPPPSIVGKRTAASA